MNAEAVFLAAYELISDPKMWIQGQSIDGAGRCCSVGAISNPGSRGLYQDWGLPEDAVYGALSADLPEDPADTLTPLAYFNDTHTHAEVIAHWRKTGEREGWLEKQS